MPKIKTHPWDPADHIVDGEDVLVYLKVIAPEEYDPVATPYLMDCIRRSEGIAEVVDVEFHEQDGEKAVTVTVANGASATIAIAPEVDVETISNALVPARAPEPIVP